MVNECVIRYFGTMLCKCVTSTPNSRENSDLLYVLFTKYNVVHVECWLLITTSSPFQSSVNQVASAPPS